MFMCCVSLLRLVAASLMALCFFHAALAGAEDLLPPIREGTAFAGRIETSSGFDATATSWGAYSSAVIAPLGPLDSDGLRLKLYGSYGMWSYDTKRVCAGSPQELQALIGVSLSVDCRAVGNLNAQEREALSRAVAPYGLHLEGDRLYLTRTHTVTRFDVAAMPGWQASGSGIALKAYFGPAMETRQIMPLDSANALSGTFWGAKTAIESWMALGEHAWLTVDGSYFTGTHSYTGALRLGLEAASWLTLGPEAAAFGDELASSARAGGFVRLTIGKTEATVSGGISADYDGTMSPYGQAGVYVRF